MRPNSIQFLYYAASMASWLFIPVLASELGASRFEVGLIGAVYGLALFASTYLFGRASDIKGRRIFIRLGLALSTVTFLLQILAVDAASLLLIRALCGFTMGILIAPLIAYVHEAGGSMGRLSSFGSLGWAVGTLIAGIIGTYTHIFAFSSLLFLVALFLSLKMEGVKGERVEIPLFPREIIKRNLNVYASYFLRNMGATAIWIIFPLFLLDIGATKFWIGFVHFANCFAQFFIMPCMDRYRDTRLISSGLLLSSAVFFSYSLATSYLQIIPLQLVLALSWSFLYVGSLLYMTGRNVERATSVGMLSATIYISGAVGPFMGGAIAQLWGFSAVMYFASLSSFVGYLMCRCGE